MRTAGLALLTLATASTFAVAKPAEGREGGGSLEALLDRLAEKANSSSSARAKATAAPGAPPAKSEKGKPENEDKEAKKEEKRQLDLSFEEDEGPHDKIIKRLRSKRDEENAKRWHKVRSPHAGVKRWIWANSIIQDDTPASEVPSIGVNVDQLGGGAYTRTTPAATLVRPTFPPLSSSSSQTPPAESPTPSPVSVDAAAVTPAAVAGSNTPAPAAPTSSANATQDEFHWYNPKDLLEEIEEGFSKLFHHFDHATSTSTAAPTLATAEVEKRWVWSGQIIQDDTPGAPALGAGNVNLLNPDAAVNTPAAALVPPSFPPLAAAASDTSSSSKAAFTTPPPGPRQRMTWKSAHEALLHASSSSAAQAAAQQTAAARQIAARHFAGANAQRMAKAKRHEAIA
ncbi:hypothetical protein Rhopal_007557-T1 [Rhodotorula paludigena]|uniref:Uncharacterized protein n=1 Tax=Rhodotorula paludigena TaxID=86838 RepID=A0AAV5GZR4_9BASI|nr:hypothetical protein Rhopal_007557-T1 [Rhodotorula paludigena]